MHRLSCVAALAFCLLASDAHAGWSEAQAAYERKDWQAAVRELQPLVQAGHLEATSRMGHLYLHGWGTAQNPAEAIRLLKIAADRGDALAQNTLGGLMFSGKHLPKDVSQAIQLFEKAAAQGQPNAINNLGQLYFAGNGVPQDFTKALQYLRQAAERNIPASMEALGLAYWNGQGVPADHNQAVTWFRRAAENDMLVSQNRLAYALWTGDGIPPNQVEAVQWFEKAGDRGDGPSNFSAGIAYQNGQGVAKDNFRAAVRFIMAARTAKPNHKESFEKKRDEMRLLLAPASWVEAEDEASRKLQSVSNAPRKDPPKKTAGSGFIVNKSGTVITNAHVVDGCRSVYVTLENAPPQRATLLDRDPVNDLATLNTPLTNVEPVKFREDKPIRSGDAVVAVGFPLSNVLSREANVTAGVISALAGMQGDKRHYQVTAPVQKGNSGGPLADMSGNVVGIVTSKLDAISTISRTGDLPQNVNFAIRSEVARKYLTDRQISYSIAASPHSLSAADVGELIKKTTVLVECQK